MQCIKKDYSELSYKEEQYIHLLRNFQSSPLVLCSSCLKVEPNIVHDASKLSSCHVWKSKNQRSFHPSVAFLENLSPNGILDGICSSKCRACVS